MPRRDLKEPRRQRPPNLDDEFEPPEGREFGPPEGSEFGPPPRRPNGSHRPPPPEN